MRWDSSSRSLTPFVGVIYGVREMGSQEFRYVGLTTKMISHRKREHLKVAASGRKTPFADWLRSRTDEEEAFFSSLELVMSDDIDDLGHAEQRWISKLRAEGHRLLNLNDGGLGNHGYVWTPEQRAAAAERMRGTKRPNYPRGPDNALWGRPKPAELKARWSAQRKGTNAGAANPNFGRFGPEHPAYGRKLSDETRARLSGGKRGELNPNFGKTMSADDRRIRSEKLKGRPMPSSVRNAHTRYHTNKGVFKDTCKHCQDDRLARGGENQ
jgi:hypothetical protein